MFFYEFVSLTNSSKMSIFTTLYSNFDFYHTVSASPTGVELNNCPRGDQTRAKLAKILHVDFWGHRAFMKKLSTLQQKKKCLFETP